MSKSKVNRKIDNLGRIVLPADLRKNLEMAKQDEVEIFIDKNAIVIKKRQSTCTFCGSTEAKKAKFLKGQMICEKCLAEITKGNFDK